MRKNRRSFFTSNSGYFASVFTWYGMPKPKTAPFQILVALVGFVFWTYIAIVNFLEYFTKRSWEKEIESHFKEGE